MIEFKLPSLGADMDRGTLLEWRVQPGQAVKKGDVVAVVDTTKAAVDVEIWVDGTVHRLVAAVGQDLPVGTVMAELLAPGESAPDAAAMSRAGAPAAPAAAPARQVASPAARRRAAELHLDLAGLAGSGASGAITLEDVERAAALVAAPAPPETPPPPADRQADMRHAIAAAMSRSKQEIPHYYLAETVPMRKALDWLHEANAQRPLAERLLPAALLLKAVALAVRDFPEMNGWFVDGVFHPGAVAHIGVAIALRQGGLIAPALHDVGGRELGAVMFGLADLVRRCRAGRLRSSEMSDPTLTVTNLGDQGVEDVFGVIYPPQVALVGFGRITERAWVQDGQLVVMPLVRVSLSADHRVSDGHRGAMFLMRLAELLQHPDKL
jgi:pyruvate dehydrogenase E2 component (dihydrolipoamide acetyltransferase)